MIYYTFGYLLIYELHYFLLILISSGLFVAKCTGANTFKKSDSKLCNVQAKTFVQRSLTQDIEKIRIGLSSRSKKKIDKDKVCGVLKLSGTHSDKSSKSKKSNRRIKRHKISCKKIPAASDIDKEKICNKKRKKGGKRVNLKTINKFEGNSISTTIKKTLNKKKVNDLTSGKLKNDRKSERSVDVSRNKKNSQNGESDKEENYDKDDKIHDTVEKDGNQKNAIIIGVEDENENTTIDEIKKRKSSRKSSQSKRKTKTSEHKLKKFCDSDTKKIRNVFKTASFDKDHNIG